MQTAEVRKTNKDCCWVKKTKTLVSLFSSNVCYFRTTISVIVHSLSLFSPFPTLWSWPSFSLFESKKFSAVTNMFCFVATFVFCQQKGLTSRKSKNKVLFVCFCSSRSFSTKTCFFLLGKGPMSVKCRRKKK